jgi:predicted permease
LDWPDYWIPIVNYFGPDDLQRRTSNALTVLGRLKPGVTPEQAAENLSAIATQLAKEHPKTDTGTPLRLVRPGLFADNGDVIRGFLYSVTGLALLVLVAACANLASLFAARAADRSRELALRVALGASRWRLVQQLMTEAMVLSMVGGAAGLVTASLLLGALNRWQSPYGHVAVSVNAPVYLAAVIFTLISALLFGIIPARQVWQSSPLQAMKSGPVDATPLRRFALRDLLLGAQIAICTLLVTASFVAVRGMVRMLHAPLGFQPQGAMVAEMVLSEEGDVQLEKKKAMLEAVRSMPGVTAAGTVSKLPFTGGLRGIPVFPPGTTEFTLNNSVLEPYRLTISPAYFEAAGTRLLSGRDISWYDTAQTPYVAVVNATFARKMWGETPAIGQRFIVLGHLREVVGVVEDSKYNEIAESPLPAFYLPFSQKEQAHTTFVVRSQRAAERDGGSARTHPEWLRARCVNHGAELARCDGRCAVPGPGGRQRTRSHGPAGGDAGGDGHLRHGRLQREPPDEGAGDPRRVGRAHEARHDGGGGAANGAARGRIAGGAAVVHLRQPVIGADRVSSKSARSRSRGRRGANDGAAGRCSVRHSSAASACCRSIQTPAGRVTERSRRRHLAKRLDWFRV